MRGIESVNFGFEKRNAQAVRGEFLIEHQAALLHGSDVGVLGSESLTLDRLHLLLRLKEGEALRSNLIHLFQSLAECS